VSHRRKRAFAEAQRPRFCRKSTGDHAVSGETTRTPRHLGSQTAFHFEILSALWLTQKCDLLAKTGHITAGGFSQGPQRPYAELPASGSPFPPEAVVSQSLGGPAHVWFTESRFFGGVRFTASGSVAAAPCGPGSARHRDRGPTAGDCVNHGVWMHACSRALSIDRRTLGLLRSEATPPASSVPHRRLELVITARPPHPDGFAKTDAAQAASTT
jgi:hypothetical protein